MPPDTGAENLLPLRKEFFNSIFLTLDFQELLEGMFPSPLKSATNNSHLRHAGVMKKSDPFNESQILLYQTEDGRQRIEVRLENETVWLSQKLMAELFQTTPQNINIHLKNIFSEGELSVDSVSKESLITASDGKKYRTQLYRLEVLLPYRAV